MANILEKIVADKAIEVAQRKQDFPLSAFEHLLEPSARGFKTALSETQTSFILECKKASPSKGLIRDVFDLNEICGVYKDYATCISVLTDEKYFQGSFDYLKTVSGLVEQPLICKDFFIDAYQVKLARYFGGNAILLMLSVLDDQQYQELADVARSLNMDILTEVSNEEEVHRALALNADIIGINNRNLRDLSTDLATSYKLRTLIPADKLVISESGIYHHQQVKALSRICNGFLVGSSLMAQADLRAACRKLITGEHKYCGLTRVEDATAAHEAGATWGGLIFYPKSPRYIAPDDAKQLASSVPLQFVGVFVNESPDKVAMIAQQLSLAAVQLHGNEDEAYIQTLKSQLPAGCEIWKALPVKDQQPVFNLSVDRYLLDCWHKELPGGSGNQFDWSLLADLPLDTKVMLAGGLSPDNIADAVAQPVIGLDINSGVELSPGVKDKQRIAHTASYFRKY